MLITSHTVRGACPACGAQHAACGTASDTVPVDTNVKEAVVGAALRRYIVTTPAGVETLMKLNQEDAQRLGAVSPDPEPEATSSESTPPPEEKTAAPPANKARRVRGKAASGGG